MPGRAVIAATGVFPQGLQTRGSGLSMLGRGIAFSAYRERAGASGRSRSISIKIRSNGGMSMSLRIGGIPAPGIMQERCRTDEPKNCS